ncbi:MAG: hypothetical protein U0T31_00445 [Chitinophagales bacterium]
MSKNKQVISVLSIDAGASLLGGAMPNNSMLGNGVSASINAYFPVWKIKTTPTFKATFGLNVGIGVQSLSNRPPKQNILPSAFNIQNQSGAPILTNKIGSSNWKTSALPEAGIQAELTVHNFNITPILNLGFAKFKGNTDTLTQKGSFNGKEQQKDIYTQEVKDIKGLVVSPKLRLGYSFKNVGIYMEGSYTFVNSGTSSTSTFKPNGEPSKEGTYSIDQIISGSYIKKETTKKFNSYGIKFGISIPLGRSIDEPGISVKSDPKPKKKKANALVRTGNNGGKGIVTGTGGNAKGINEAGIKVVEEQNEARKGWDGTVKGKPAVVEEQNEARKGWDGTVKNGSTKVVEDNDASIRKGWDGTVKGKPAVVEEQNEARKGWDGTVKNGSTKVVEDNDASIRKGWDGTVKGKPAVVEEQNEARKGWDGTVKNGSTKAVEEQSEARKGWDGTVKNGSTKAVEEQNEARKGWDGTVKNGSTKAVEEQDEARKGWDGTVKNGSTKAVEDNDASIRKGWDGTVKNGSTKVVEEQNEAKKGWDGTVKNGSTKAVEEQNEARKGWDGSVKGNSKGIQEAGIKRQEDMPKNNVKDLSTEPTAPQPQNQPTTNTTKSNTKDKAIQNSEDTTSTSGRSSGENPMFEGTGSARPGNPIPGIIVKGGKNPGAQKITLTSNNNGEVSLNNLEIGSYAFEVSKPGQSPNGVIVKGEKISGGQMQIINNNNGKFEFTISEKGNYKIQFSTPNTNSKGIQEAGIK